MDKSIVTASQSDKRSAKHNTLSITLNRQTKRARVSQITDDTIEEIGQELEQTGRKHVAIKVSNESGPMVARETQAVLWRLCYAIQSRGKLTLLLGTKKYFDTISAAIDQLAGNDEPLRQTQPCDLQSQPQRFAALIHPAAKQPLVA